MQPLHHESKRGSFPACQTRLNIRWLRLLYTSVSRTGVICITPPVLCSFNGQYGCGQTQKHESDSPKCGPFGCLLLELQAFPLFAAGSSRLPLAEASC